MPRKTDETPAEAEVVQVEAVQAEPEYDPETQVITEDGEVKPMPSGSWTAALTEGGNLRRSKGLLVLAE